MASSLESSLGGGASMSSSSSGLSARASHPSGRVTIVGTARNAKGGAVVLDEQRGRTVYVDALHGWDNEYVGQTVEVTGRLVHRSNYLPAAHRDSDGSWSQGVCVKPMD